MIFLNNNLLNYGLHESKITDLKCLESKMILSFEDGFYILNENQKLLDKTKASKMIIEIDDLKVDTIYQHIKIIKKNRKKYKEISYENFLYMIKESGFRIYLDYYSQFANSILLKGNSSKNEIEFVITDIEKINYIID